MRVVGKGDLHQEEGGFTSVLNGHFVVGHENKLFLSR